jgi:hypothetical protein
MLILKIAAGVMLGILALPQQAEAVTTTKQLREQCALALEVTANKLLLAVGKQPSVYAAAYGSCFAFVEAAVGTFEQRANMKLCRDDWTMSDTARMFVEFTKKHPELDERPGLSVMWFAMVKDCSR